jgi:hypothetical protein
MCSVRCSRLWFVPVVIAALSTGAHAQSASKAAESSPRDGARDFDWEIGTWNTHLRRLAQPLSGSTEWIEYTGTSVVSEVMGGKANMVELDAQGPGGRIEGINLRLYNPTTRQWSLYYASARGGVITPPVTGSFENGRGEFYGLETYDGKPIFVRFVISVITPDSAEFEQAFSADGGKTWEVNWIAIDTRVKGAAKKD